MEHNYTVDITIRARYKYSTESDDPEAGHEALRQDLSNYPAQIYNWKVVREEHNAT